MNCSCQPDRSVCVRGIVGLGNPGARYAGSRHNVGFVVIDRLHHKYSGAGWKTRQKGWTAQIRMEKQNLMLLKPSTFMNLSGAAVSDFLNDHGIEPDELLVIHDDLDIDSRQIRIKMGGGHGGHNGIRSIIQSIGTPEFCRIRVGIGRPVHEKNTVDFVLSSPENEDEKSDLLQSIDLAVSAVETIVFDNRRTAMERFNRRNKQTPIDE